MSEAMLRLVLLILSATIGATVGYADYVCDSDQGGGCLRSCGWGPCTDCESRPDISGQSRQICVTSGSGSEWACAAYDCSKAPAEGSMCAQYGDAFKVVCLLRIYACSESLCPCLSGSNCPG
jgi:hypothetical protein